MSARKADAITLCILALIYLAIFAYFYPPLPGIEDEVGFINQALMWKAGGYSAESAGIWPPFDSMLVDGHHVPYRNAGRSILLLPFLYLGGFDSIFWSGPLIHLATVFIFALACSGLGISILWSALILLHPTFLIYSRTIMADELAGLMILLSFYLYLRTGSRNSSPAKTSPQGCAPFWIGLPIGFGFLARSHIPLVVPAFVVSAWKDQRVNFKSAAGFAFGMLIFVAVAVAYSYKLFSQPVVPRFGVFGPEFLSEHFPFYLIALGLLWPALVLAPVLYRGPHKWFFILATYPFLLFFSLYYFRDKIEGSHSQSLIVGLRFLQIALPVWILCYSLWLTDLAKNIPLVKQSSVWSLRFIILVAPIFPLVALNSAHSRHLEKLKIIKEAVENTIPENSLVVTNAFVSKLISIPTEGQKQFRVLPIELFEANEQVIAAEKQPWFVVMRPKVSMTGLEDLERYKTKYQLLEWPSTISDLYIYQSK